MSQIFNFDLNSLGKWKAMNESQDPDLSEDEIDPVDPGKIHRDIGVNFLVLICALQESIMDQSLTGLEFRKGMFNPGLIPDDVNKSVETKIVLLASLCEAYAAFSDGYEYKSK